MDINLDLIIKLKIISSIQENQRLDLTSGELRIYNGGMYNYIVRVYTNDNRVKSIMYIDRFYKQIYNLAKDDDDVKKIFHDSLKSSVDGLLKLRNTYYSDINFISRIDVIIENIINPLLETAT